MHDLLKSQVLTVECNGVVDVVDDVADLYSSHPNSSQVLVFTFTIKILYFRVICQRRDTARAKVTWSHKSFAAAENSVLERSFFTRWSAKSWASTSRT